MKQSKDNQPNLDADTVNQILTVWQAAGNLLKQWEVFPGLKDLLRFTTNQVGLMTANRERDEVEWKKIKPSSPDMIDRLTFLCVELMYQCVVLSTYVNDYRKLHGRRPENFLRLALDRSIEEGKDDKQT